MVKVGKWIAKNKILILILATILLIPSLYGMKTMKTNYDLLTYLPKNLDTVKDQDIVVDQFGMGAFSMVVVENKALKDTAQLEKDIEAIPPIVSNLNSLSGTVDRMDALKNGDLSYDNFSGISDDMDGTVKFVITTESIKAATD